MFITLLMLLTLPFISVLALWYINDTIPFCIQYALDNTCYLFFRYVAPIILKSAIYTTKFVSELRSNYIWETRCYYPCLPRYIMDRFMFIDSCQANLSISSGHESVRIERAIVSYEGTDYDVSDMMDMIWVCGDGDSVEFSLHRLLAYENVFLKSETPISLRVRYTGHTNIDKRYHPQSYTVRYKGTMTDTATFPPYPSSLCIKKGFGVTKVVTALKNDGTSCIQEARESSGLRGKFYNDIKSIEMATLVPNVVNFLDESQRIHEDLRIKIDTSRGPIEFN